MAYDATLLSELYNIQRAYAAESVELDKNSSFCHIDSKERTITVPPEIDYISVQYDHRSFRLNFEIDRYINNIDLLTQTCVIQWVNNGENGEQMGFHPVVFMDSSIPDKLLFTWEIYNDATQNSGTIQFAVVFYSMRTETSFLWCYNTLPAQSIIKDTLDVVVQSSSEIKPSILLEWNERMRYLENSVSEAANSALYYSRQAEAWTHGRSDYPSSIIDNSKYYKDMTAAIYDEAKGTIDGEKNNVIIAINDVRDQGIVQISEAKNQALQDISDVKDSAISEIEIAKNELLNSVPNYEESIDELENQLNVISESVAELDNKLGNAANGIVNKTSGNSIIVNDSSESRLRGLRVFGKTEQQTYTGKNLFNPENVLNDTYFFESDVQLQSSPGAYTVFAECESNTTYTVSRIPGQRFAIAYTKDTTPVIGTNIYGVIRNDDASSITLTTGEGATYIVAFVYNANHDTISLEDMLASVQIEKGDTATEYELYVGGIPSPNPQYPQELVSVGDDGDVEVGVYGRNLFSGLSKDITLYATNGQIVKGTYTRSCIINVSDINSIYVSGDFSLLYPKGDEGGYMYFGLCQEYPVEGISCKRIDLLNNGVIDVSGCKYLLASARYKDDNELLEEAVANSFMFSIGTKEIPYEPYKGKTLPISTPSGLPGIPVTKVSLATYTDSNGQMWCADEVDFERGVYVKRVEKCFVTGSTIMYYITNENYCELQPDNLLYRDSRLPVMSDYFHYSHSTKIEGDAFAYKATIRLYKTFTNLSEARIWFDNNDVYVMYILAEPIETPLSEEELASYRSLHTNYPVTTIMNDSGAHMEAKYNADTKIYIDNKFTELQNAIMSLKS